jgi:uncharacterized protein
MENNNLEKIKKFVKEKHSEKDFNRHIKPVVKNALLLAKKLDADINVVEVSAYLHDIGRAKYTEGANEEEHHIIGAKKAEEILKELKYGREFIEKVKHCILAHRGSKEPDPETIEAKIVNTADAMSHFDSFLDLVAVFYEDSNFDFEKTIALIDAKIDRDWNKKITIPEAKKIVRKKYDAIKLLIKSAKENMG